MITVARFAVAMVLGQAAVEPTSPVLSVLTLDQALRQTQTRNLDIKQAIAKLEQANQASWKAWSYYLPQITANGIYTRNEREVTQQIPQGYAVQDFGTRQPPPTGAQLARSGGADTTLAVVPYNVTDLATQKRDQLVGTLRVTQAILAPTLWPAIKNAYRSEHLASTNVESARRDILFGVAQLYYGAAGLKQAVMVQERQLAIARNHEKDARVRYQTGTTPKVALLRAEIDRARAEQDLKRAQNGYLSAKQQIATLLDQSTVDFEVEVPAEQKPPTEEVPLEEVALRDRPDVQAARQNLVLAEGIRTGHWFQYLPLLGAFGQVIWSNVEGSTGQRTNWALGLSLNWTIFDGGLREANVRDSQAKVAEAEFAQRSVEAKAREDVRRSLLDLDSARANKSTGKEQVQLARENEKLTEVNFRAGAATYLEVADAQAALLSAELNYVAESLNVDLATLRLQKATGAFRGPEPER